MSQAFDDIRVVDLSNSLSGAYTARMFGDHGADVVLVEKQCGHLLRSQGPFSAEGESLIHAYVNWNKRSIVVKDLEELGSVVTDAHIVITSEQPPWSEEFNDLVSRLGVKTIHLSITPHGLDGPLSTIPGNNLTTCARVGWSHINGREGEPPLQLPVNQTGYIAGVAGFVAACAALFRWQQTGMGESIDVSEIEAVSHTNAPWAILGQFIGGGRLSLGPNGPRVKGNPGPLWQTADGLMNFGFGDWPKWREAMSHLGLDGLAEDEKYLPVLGRHQQDARPVRAALAEAVATRNKWDVFHELAKLRCICGVVQDAADLLINEQLNAREFFAETTVGQKRVKAPGAPAKLSVSQWSVRRSAPLLGEHSEEIHNSVIPNVVRDLSEKRKSPDNQSQPLAGVRILTFTQAWSGAFGTELLALLGADVVQIESRKRPDVWRGAGAPVPPAVRNADIKQSPLNTNGMYNSVNLNKKAITLDMQDPIGRELFWRMVPAFDVVADNFSPHVMVSWGITMETLKAKRADIIFASLSGYGGVGPIADYPANGATTEPMSGLSAIHGYENDTPMNTGGLIPDPICGYYFAAAILTALFYRQQAGVGQRVDESMMEAVAVQVGEAVLAYGETGNSPGPAGNSHPSVAPHGMYEAQNDEWLAIAAETEATWSMLAQHMGRPELTSDRLFSTAALRKKNEAALNGIVSEWLKGRDAAQEEDSLNAIGVCAARARPFLEIYQQPSAQFNARGFLLPITHPESGTHFIPVAPWKMMRTQVDVPSCSPCFGEHSQEVLEQELGIDAQEFEELVAKGITGTQRIY